MTEWREGDIAGVVVRPVRQHVDSRGWLAELFRADEVSPQMAPRMSYVSVTRPGVARGPHEHVEQTDVFAFVGPGDFRLKLWDNRPASATHGAARTLLVGASSPSLVVVPPGVVHGYANVSEVDGWVINFPNRLYAGEGRRQPVDEIRHENEDASPFQM